MDTLELGTCLRHWRDRIGPEDVGIRPARRRRLPGLRRQEVSTLGGISVEYLARLEQGRAGRPSAEVLSALAETLRLSRDERDHLFRLAGHATPAGAANRLVPPSLRRIVDRLTDAAVVVIDVEWNVVLANPLAVALLGAVGTAPGAAGNHLRRQFGDGAPSRVRHTPQQDRAFEAMAVAALREAAGRFPGDAAVRALIDELDTTSSRFRDLWATGDLEPALTHRKTIAHPELGDVEVDCDVIVDATTDLRIVIYSAPSGTADAQALSLLSDSRPGRAPSL